MVFRIVFFKTDIIWYNHALTYFFLSAKEVPHLIEPALTTDSSFENLSNKLQLSKDVRKKAWDYWLQIGSITDLKVINRDIVRYKQQHVLHFYLVFWCLIDIRLKCFVFTLENKLFIECYGYPCSNIIWRVQKTFLKISHHWKNCKFENFVRVSTENGESRTRAWINILFVSPLWSSRLKNLYSPFHEQIFSVSNSGIGFVLCNTFLERTESSLLKNLESRLFRIFVEAWLLSVKLRYVPQWKWNFSENIK